MDIPIFYDPLIAKLIVHGKDREEAIARMLRAIDEYQITGVSTTLQFCSFVLKHNAFVSGKFDTNFIKNYYKPEMLDTATETEAEIAALLGVFLTNKDAKIVKPQGADVIKTRSKWKTNRVN